MSRITVSKDGPVAERVDPICDRFEDALKAGRQPKIDEYVVQALENDRPWLAEELRRLELAYREKGDGKRPAADAVRYDNKLRVVEVGAISESEKRDADST